MMEVIKFVTNWQQIHKSNFDCLANSVISENLYFLLVDNHIHIKSDWFLCYATFFIIRQMPHLIKCILPYDVEKLEIRFFW